MDRQMQRRSRAGVESSVGSVGDRMTLAWQDNYRRRDTRISG
jgi:hypothetical protein